MTLNVIPDIILEIVKPHLKDTRYYNIGFIECDEDKVFVTKDKSLFQNDKPAVLMKAGSRLHKEILKVEVQEDIRFERLEKETMEKLYLTTFFRFTDEEGNAIDVGDIYKPMPLTPLPDVVPYDKYAIREPWVYEQI